MVLKRMAIALVGLTLTVAGSGLLAPARVKAASVVPQTTISCGSTLATPLLLWGSGQGHSPNYRDINMGLAYILADWELKEQLKAEVAVLGYSCDTCPGQSWSCAMGVETVDLIHHQEIHNADGSYTVVATYAGEVIVNCYTCPYPG